MGTSNQLAKKDDDDDVFEPEVMTGKQLENRSVEGWLVTCLVSEKMQAYAVVSPLFQALISAGSKMFHGTCVHLNVLFVNTARG